MNDETRAPGPRIERALLERLLLSRREREGDARVLGARCVMRRELRGGRAELLVVAAAVAPAEGRVRPRLALAKMVNGHPVAIAVDIAAASRIGAALAQGADVAHELVQLAEMEV